MRVVPLSDPNDPQLAAYTDLRRSRSGSSNAIREATFIAEGRWVVNRLIQSDYEIESLLVQQGSEDHFDDLVSPQTPVFTMSAESIRNVVGFDFHRGVMACGRRREIPSITSLIGNQSIPDAPDGPMATNDAPRRRSTLMGRLSLGLLGVCEQENLGSILRSAAAFGVENILLGHGTIDPFSRRVIRVSMGTVFKHRFFGMSDPINELSALQQQGIRTIASTLSTDSQPITEFRRDDRSMILLIGNEATGIDPSIQAAVTDRVKIPISADVDSLNAAVATAILVHRLRSQ